MHPVFGLWLGLLVIYFIVTGTAELTVRSWQHAFNLDFMKKEKGK